MANQDPLDRSIIHEGSWKGDYWGRSGVIVRSKQRSQRLAGEGKRQEALSALSSTYYSAATQAMARFQTTPITHKPVWGFRALWCLRKAKQLSDELERHVSVTHMMPDQLDIRGRILFVRKRYGEALRVTWEALRRINLTPDTRALLLMGLAEIKNAQNNREEAAEAYQGAFQLVDALKPTTTVRLYRSLAGYHRSLGDLDTSREVAREAMRIAVKHGLDDQKIKIEPFL